MSKHWKEHKPLDALLQCYSEFPGIQRGLCYSRGGTQKSSAHVKTCTVAALSSLDNTALQKTAITL